MGKSPTLIGVIIVGIFALASFVAWDPLTSSNKDFG